MNETMNEIMETENIEVTDVEYVDQENSAEAVGVVLGVIGVVAVGVGVAGVALWRKYKNKIEEHNVNKLRKKGYVVYKAEECEVVEVDVEENVEEFENESETNE